MEIKFKDFTLLCENHVLFDNINCTLKKDKYSLNGMNGAGKSTLLNCLYGLHDNYLGSIYIDGINIKSINKRKLKESISYINQKFIFFEYLNIYQNVILLVSSKNVQNRILKEMNQEFGVSRNIIVQNLSGGQKQYFNILLNIFNNNKILLLDEPFNNLSTDLIYKVNRHIENLDKFIIIVSHKKNNYIPILISKKRLICKR